MRVIEPERNDGGEAGAEIRSTAALPLLVLSAFAALIPAFLYRVFFDRVIPDHDYALFLPVLVLLIILEAAGVLTRYAADRLLCTTTRIRTHRRRIALVHRIGRLGTDWFDEDATGAVVRHYEDAAVLGSRHAAVLRELVGPALVVASLLPAVLILQPLLAILRVAAALPAMAAGRRFLEQDLRLERAIWSVRRRITTALVRGARCHATLRCASAADDYARSLRKAIRSQGHLEEQRAVSGAGWDAAAAMAGRLGGAAVLTAAVFMVMKGRITFGAYIAFSILSSRLTAALAEMFTGFRSVARIGNAVERSDVLSRREAAGPFRSSTLHHKGRGRQGLIVSGLCYAYPDGPVVLSHLSLGVRPGERVLISGPSGSGKSTLFHLLLGLLTPDSGYLSFDGRPLGVFTDGFGAGRVGAVLQNPVFFDGTVRENLCCFRPPPPDRRIRDALDCSGASTVVERFEGGLDGLMNGEDSGLSGGQRQRLAVARMLLQSPDLVLLDEPTNALDAAGSADVMRSLNSACAGRTVLLISHGSPSGMEIDRELVLHGGVLTGRRDGGMP